MRISDWSSDVCSSDLAEEGLRRYGFHGLSYEFIAGALSDYDGAAATGRTVVAHLGNGASLCALADGRSHACTMGFSTLDGLIKIGRASCRERVCQYV